MNNPLETILEKYGLTDILVDNDIEDLTVLRLLIAEGLIDLDEYDIAEEELEEDE